MSNFAKYYRIAASEEADIGLRRWALDACLGMLDKLVVEEGRRSRPESPDAMPRDAVSKAVSDELNVMPRADHSASTIRRSSLFVALLIFRLLNELHRFRAERCKGKARGIRRPGRPAFSKPQVLQIVRSVHGQLDATPRPRGTSA